MSADARGTVRTRIRAALESARESAPTPSAPTPAGERAGSWSVPVPERSRRFQERLESVGGHVWLPQTTDEVGATLDRLLVSLAPARLAVSDAPDVLARVHAFTKDHPSVTVIPASAGRSALIEAEVGVSGAQWGIAETGTLVLDSSAEQHRLVSLLPTVHIALLPVAAILGTLGEALRLVRDETGAVRSRTVTFVTGPSRTADIELTLVVGVHGPKELHVILTPEAAR